MSTPPHPFFIRPAFADDATILTALRRALFEELGQQLTPEKVAIFENESTAAFASGLEQGSCLAWIAEADGRAVSSVALLLFPRLPTLDVLAQREAYLLNVYTAPEWRGRGAATALVAAAVAEARTLGMARIRLHASAEGQRIYSAAGFASRVDEMELRLG